MLIYTILVLAAVALAVTLYCLDRVWRREALFRWASANGLKVLAFKQPLMTEQSAFPLSTSKSQQVWRVEVETPQHQHQTGWVRVGSPWFGLASSRADVKWDDAPEA